MKKMGHVNYFNLNKTAINFGKLFNTENYRALQSALEDIRHNAFEAKITQALSKFPKNEKEILEAAKDGYLEKIRLDPTLSYADAIKLFPDDADIYKVGLEAYRDYLSEKARENGGNLSYHYSNALWDAQKYFPESAHLFKYKVEYPGIKPREEPKPWSGVSLLPKEKPIPYGSR